MQRKNGYTAVALSLFSAASFGMLGSVALANGRDFNDGPVVNVSAIRTADGHFDPGAVSEYLGGPGWGHLAAYLGA